jgi:16S rRNA (uracil1498-N3)-methyltransferase
MQVFYARDISDEFHTLDETESKHTIRVLRMKRGDQVKLIDGKGNLYEAVIENPDQKSCMIKIVSVTRGFEKRPYNLHIAISPLKNPDRFEWFVEKSVEIGIDEITPLICANTEKEKIKEDRLRNIIISAMKQSLKASLPQLNSPVLFHDFVKKSHSGTKLIAHCHNENRQSILQAYVKGDDAVIMIGPEGDFTPDEVGTALKSGFQAIHLGGSRLRTETAGVAACHSIYMLNY